MNKTFNGENLYLLDIRTLSPYRDEIFYGTFQSPKCKKFDLRMFTNPIAITGQHQKQYLVYSLNDQMQVQELGAIVEEKIKIKISPNTFMAKFKNFYVSTSKLEIVKLYKKHCSEAKKRLEYEIEKIPPFHESSVIYYLGIMGKIDEVYHDFLKQIKQL